MAAAAQPGAFNDIMDHDPSFDTILNSFGLTVRARNRFTEDFETARQLMLATEDQITQVISNQNKLYRNHSQANHRCYINATQTTRIQTFRKWSIIAVKEGGAMYDVGDVGEFTSDWVDEILDEFNQTKTNATTPGALSVKVPKFNGNNWYEVKSALLMALSAVYGEAGIPLTYLVRDIRKTWEQTDGYASLQHRRIDTKAHDGSDFNKDNADFYRILGQEFTSTTLEDVIKNITRSDGVRACKAILMLREATTGLN